MANAGGPLKLEALPKAIVQQIFSHLYNPDKRQAEAVRPLVVNSAATRDQVPVS